MTHGSHLTIDDLILFMDREMEKKQALAAEQHLLSCVECDAALQGLRNGSAGYQSYHEHGLKPALNLPADWAPIGGRLAANRSTTNSRGVSPWWALAAAASLVGISLWAWFFYRPSSEPAMQDLLTKAAAAQVKTRNSLLFASRQYQFARPAVLEAGNSEARFQHTRSLFLAANYSWQDPLSATSFASWRRQLSEKRDSVTSFNDGDGRRYYRVRTRTDSNILQSASLVLVSETYRPASANFEFKGEDPLEVSEQTKSPEPLPVTPLIHSRTTEMAASPEDELRVFAALDAIGADTEEPIDVKLDPARHNVLVTGLGMPAGRRKQIENALSPLPNVIVRFSAAQPMRTDSGAIAQADTTSDNGSPPFRQKLQEMAGGVRSLQSITDESLELTNSLFAQSHSLLVLAHEFPPPIQSALSPAAANTLLALRQRHLGAMSYAVHHLKDQLKPLLNEETGATPNANTGSWQNNAESLYEVTRNLDHIVSRLLAGSYDEQTGDLMLKELPEDIAKVETLVLADSQ